MISNEYNITHQKQARYQDIKISSDFKISYDIMFFQSS